MAAPAGGCPAAWDVLGSPRYEAANHLTDDRYFDNLSGQQAYKCFACRLGRARPRPDPARVREVFLKEPVSTGEYLSGLRGGVADGYQPEA